VRLRIKTLLVEPIILHDGNEIYQELIHRMAGLRLLFFAGYTLGILWLHSQLVCSFALCLEVSSSAFTCMSFSGNVNMILC
jgi:hypothetical protein